MKHLTALAFFLIFATPMAFATNGANLIGASPTSVSMGGTGMASYNGPTDALFKNPALLTTGEVGHVNTDLSLTLVGLSATGTFGAGQDNNLAGNRVGPQAAATYKLTPNLGVGLGFFTVSGATSDYKGDITAQEVRTDYGLGRFMAGVAYQPLRWLSIGFAPYLAYGEFALNATNPPATGVQSARKPRSAVALGWQVGAYVEPVKNLSVGVTWINKTALNYTQVINLDAYGPAALNAGTAAATSALDDIKVAQPREFAVGVACCIKSTRTGASPPIGAIFSGAPPTGSRISSGRFKTFTRSGENSGQMAFRSERALIMRTALSPMSLTKTEPMRSMSKGTKFSSKRLPSLTSPLSRLFRELTFRRVSSAMR